MPDMATKLCLKDKGSLSQETAGEGLGIGESSWDRLWVTAVRVSDAHEAAGLVLLRVPHPPDRRGLSVACPQHES